MYLHHIGQYKVKVVAIETLKVALNWTTFENCTGSLKVVPFHEARRTLQGLSELVMTIS